MARLIFSWLKGSKTSRQISRKIRRSSQRSPFGFEPLENRALLAALTVNSLDDLPVNLSDATVTLRDAIYAANQDLQVAPGGPTGAGADTIDFDPDLFAAGDHAIDLTDGLPGLSSNITITGPAADQLTVRRHTGGDYRIFDVTSGATVSLSGLTVSNGNVFGNGGGIQNGGTLTLTNCTVSGNTADDGGSSLNGSGGAIRNSGGSLTLVNCTLSGNKADLRGGAIDSNGTVRLTNCTVTQNRINIDNNGLGPGGGLQIAVGTSATLVNTIVADNFTFRGFENNIFGSVDAGKSFNNLIGTVSGGLTNGTNGNLVGVADPGLGALADNGGPTRTHALLAGSPAINKGTNNPGAPFGSLPDTDQRGLGFDRIVGGTVDIGAFEVQNQAPTDIELDGSSVDENTAGVIGSFSTTDPDSGDSHTYTLVPEAVDNALFSINEDGQLLNIAPFDYETDALYSILVRTTDAGGLSVDKVFDIFVSDVNEAPTLSVPDDQQIAFEVVDLEITGIRVSDPDVGDSLTVTLSVDHGTLTLEPIDGLEVTDNGSDEVTLSGSIDDLNAALATLVYRGSPNYSGDDELSIIVSDGSPDDYDDGAGNSTTKNVAIFVKSWARQAADLSALVDGLVEDGVLNQGQANALKLNLKDNNGDAGKVQAFLNQVHDYFLQGILDEDEAESLRHFGNILLLSVKRR